MADPREGHFRKRAVDRAASPEQLDQLLRLVTPKSWLPLLTLSAIVGILLVWSFLGRIPIYVDGKGILVRPRKIVELQSPSAGPLVRLDVGVDDRVEKGQLLGSIQQPNLEKQLELQRQKLVEIEEQSAAADRLRGRLAGLHGEATRAQVENLEKHIEETRSIAHRLRELALESIEQERQSLDDQLAMARSMVDANSQRLENHTTLNELGILSREELLAAEAAHIDSLARASALESSLRALENRKLEVQEDFLNRMQKVDELTLQLGALDIQGTELEQQDLESAAVYERQITDTRREIDRLEQALRTEGQIVADYDGRILEINVMLGQVLAPGTRIGSIAIDDTSSLESISYFTVRDGKRLKEGASIQVTPDTVERHRYGSIVGTVRSISAFPVTLAEIENVVGNPSVAEAMMHGGYLIQVFASLETDPASYSGYRWSSSRGPELEISVGTTSTSRVAVEHRRPIDFILPFLKSSAGID